MNLFDLSGAGWDFSSIQNPHSHLFGAPYKQSGWSYEGLVMNWDYQSTHTVWCLRLYVQLWTAHIYQQNFGTDKLHYNNKHLREPGPLNVGVLLSAHTAHHPVVVHRIDDCWVLLGTLGTTRFWYQISDQTCDSNLAPGDSPKEERVLVASQLCQQFVLLKT